MRSFISSCSSPLTSVALARTPMMRLPLNRDTFPTPSRSRYFLQRKEKEQEWKRQRRSELWKIKKRRGDSLNKRNEPTELLNALYAHYMFVLCNQSTTLGSGCCIHFFELVLVVVVFWSKHFFFAKGLDVTMIVILQHVYECWEHMPFISRRLIPLPGGHVINL